MIRFDYTPTFEDWRALNLHFLAKQFRILLYITGFIFLCFLLSPFAERAVGRDAPLWETYQRNLGVLFLPGIVALIYGATLYGVRRRWKTAAEVRECREFIFDETGVSVQGETFSGRTEWQNVKEADVARGLVMLKTTQNQFHFFPRAVVPDWERFASLVSRNTKVTRRFRTRK